jgi:hypothetical protein
MALDSQYLNSGLAQTGTAAEPGSIPVFDANGNILSGALRLSSALLTATGTAAGSLTARNGLYFFTGTAAATYTLPAESNAANVHIQVLNGTTNVLTIAPFGAELINGATNTTAVATNVTGSGTAAGRTFRADPSTNSGFLAT